MGIGGKREKLIETEREMLHRIALVSKQPAIKEMLKELHVLVKLYHADDIADEKEENEKFNNSMMTGIRRLISQNNISK